MKKSSEERAEEVAKIIDGIYTAKRLGTDIVRVFCGNLHGNVTYDDGQRWIVAGLKEINYSGCLSIEYEGHEDAVNRLRKLLE